MANRATLRTELGNSVRVTTKYRFVVIDESGGTTKTILRTDFIARARNAQQAIANASVGHSFHIHIYDFQMGRWIS